MSEGMKNIIIELSKYIELKQCVNNSSIYISKDCPFCGESGKRVFRLNTKLKVGKFFCCGVSFKELYWFSRQILIRGYANDYQLKNRHGLFKIISDELYFKLLEDKTSINESDFVKFDLGDEKSPF